MREPDNGTRSRPAVRIATGVVMLVFAACGGLIGAPGAYAGPLSGPAHGQPPDPALASRVAAWVSGGGSDDLTALGKDFAELESAANADDLEKMSAGCDHLLADVKAAQEYDPIPDALAEKDWANALSLYAAGATDCATGARQQDVDLITQASDEIVEGSGNLNKVTARLKDISGG